MALNTTKTKSLKRYKERTHTKWVHWHTLRNILDYTSIPVVNRTVFSLIIMNGIFNGNRYAFVRGPKPIMERFNPFAFDKDGYRSIRIVHYLRIIAHSCSCKECKLATSEKRAHLVDGLQEVYNKMRQTTIDNWKAAMKKAREERKQIK